MGCCYGCWLRGRGGAVEGCFGGEEGVELFVGRVGYNVLFEEGLEFLGGMLAFVSDGG